MLRHLVVQRAAILPAIAAVVEQSSDGGPRGQRRMQERIDRLGILYSDLTPGKRGVYELAFYDLTGWDVSRDAEIKAGDPLPEKPWLVCLANRLISEGRGRRRWELKAATVLFVTHHALSRAAQRCGVKTSQHLLAVTENIFLEVLEHRKQTESWRQWLDTIPPEGLRLPVADDAIVVLKRHEKRHAVVATTILPRR
jgi:hypothetical protein